MDGENVRLQLLIQQPPGSCKLLHRRHCCVRILQSLNMAMVVEIGAQEIYVVFFEEVVDQLCGAFTIIFGKGKNVAGKQAARIAELIIKVAGIAKI